MIDLSDVTFCIPIRVDFPERLENLQFLVSYLQRNFKTHIHVWEDGPTSLCNMDDITYTFNENTSPLFYKTRILNQLCKISHTEIIVNPYDCDVLLPIDRYVQAVEEIRQERADAIYPYDGMFVNVNRDWLPSIRENNGLDHITDGYIISPHSFGGCLFWRKSKLIEFGMQNEHFLSWGPEDNEIFERANRLGAKIGRLPGVIYHMDHRRGINSGHTNPFVSMNDREYARIRLLPPEILRAEVQEWTWVQDMNSNASSQ
jgi:hypothetical protein